MLNCPKCGSENYGYDLDENGKELFSCTDCGLGIPTNDGINEYRIQYAHACGYHD
jgi:transcription initiation factor TFIIIB Brf1 subunit/transcription initiation factor TFIIB